MALAGPTSAEGGLLPVWVDALGGRLLDLPDPPQCDRGTVRLRSELVLPAILVGGAADDAQDLQPREIADLPAHAVGWIEHGHRQAVDLGSVLRIQLHA